MTFAEMQSDVRDIVHELRTHPQYNETKLLHYLNRGCVIFARRTKCIEDTVSITTVANTFEYTETEAPGLANILIPYQIRYKDGSEVGRPLKTWPGGFTNLPEKYEYGTPYFYWVRNVHTNDIYGEFIGIKIGTWPICATSSKTINVYAFMRPATLEDDDDTPEFKDDWHDAPVHWAAYKILEKFSHLRPAWNEKCKFHRAEFERLVLEAKQDMIVQTDEPIETEDVYYQMDNW